MVRAVGPRLPHRGVEHGRHRLRQGPVAADAAELYLHPNGQLPAYEWNFSDVNPPVHAWATLLVYETELEQRGAGDVAWLKSAFQKLLVNFTWWINRKDPTGRNVFEGGFLGLDNIGVFDRSASSPTGGRLEQSDGTAWMAFYAQSMLGIASELSPATTRSTRTWSSSSPSTSPSSPPPWTASATTRRTNWTRTASSTTSSGARRQRPPAQGALDGRTAPALRHDAPARGRRPRRDDLLARLRRRIDSMPELLATISDVRRRRQRPGRCWPSSTRPNCDASSPACSTRTSSLSLPHGSAPIARPRRRPFRADVHVPPSSLPPRRVRQRHVRRQLELAWPSVVSRQLPHPAGLLRLYACYGDDFKVECRPAPDSSAPCSRSPKTSAAGSCRSSP